MSIAALKSSTVIQSFRFKIKCGWLASEDAGGHIYPWFVVRPKVGLRPTTPHNDEGTLIEPAFTKNHHICCVLHTTGIKFKEKIAIHQEQALRNRMKHKGGFDSFLTLLGELEKLTEEWQTQGVDKMFVLYLNTITFYQIKNGFWRDKPPTSVPRATGHNPDETSAVDPEDEPPVYLVTSCGFLAVLFEHFWEEIRLMYQPSIHPSLVTNSTRIPNSASKHPAWGIGRWIERGELGKERKNSSRHQPHIHTHRLGCCLWFPCQARAWLLCPPLSYHTVSALQHKLHHPSLLALWPSILFQLAQTNQKKLWNMSNTPANN